MLTNGYLHLSPDAVRAAPGGTARSDFGAPAVFVPQKALVKRRIAMTAGAAVLVITATVLALI